VIFWLGTHRPSWLERAGVPLMVSARTLRGRRTLPRAVAPWVLDSGGFTELSLHARWTISGAQYAEEIERASEQVGRLEWAAPQDWMCEPWILAKTGRSVAEHQALTVASVIELRQRCPNVIPVLQGWTAEDYWRHVESYAAAGIDLRAAPIVGVGSICRRQGTAFAARLVEGLARYGLRLHGFGIKSGAATQWLASADSLAWSYHARRNKVRLPLCSGHANCANCLRYALLWRERRVDEIAQRQGAQLDLFACAPSRGVSA
jgi:hypothetical protein